MTSQPQTEFLSFSQAIAATESLITKINANELSENEIKKVVSSILTTKNGGRGFFVAYLTSEQPLANNPSRGIIEGLSISIKISSELLVKNLAMSSAMVLTHRRNNDSHNAENSLRVARRTNNLIQKLNSNLIKTELEKLNRTINDETGEYQDFLTRWNYDFEQKQAIQQSIYHTLRH